MVYLNRCMCILCMQYYTCLNMHFKHILQAFSGDGYLLRYMVLFKSKILNPFATGRFP